VKVGELLLGHRSPAVLQCNKGRSHPHTVYWTFNGNPVPYGMNRFYTRGRNLTIYSSSVQDNGTYKCFGDYDRRSELDTFVIRIVSPVQFDSCGGEYCTEEIDVSSLHAKNVSSVFLSSSFTYDMNSPVKEKESAENVEWRLTENSDINIDKYCFGANHESCVLAKCGERETDACQTTAVLRGAVRDVWSRQNKSIVLNVKRLEKDLVGRMDHVTVVLRVNLPYRRNVLGKARNWVVVRAFKLYNFPTSITVTSKNCTEQDNSQCKIIVDEGESLTLCSSVDTHGRESFINSSSWIFTTKSATFNASLCTSYDSSECRNLYRRRMLVVQKEWGSCLVLKNISEELDGTRVKYRMIPAFQAKVNSILESREMTINVLTVKPTLPISGHGSDVLFYVILASLAGGSNAVLLFLGFLCVGGICVCCCRRRCSKHQKTPLMKKSVLYDHLNPRPQRPPRLPPRPVITTLYASPSGHSYISLFPEQDPPCRGGETSTADASLPGSDSNLANHHFWLSVGPMAQYPLQSTNISASNRGTRFASAPPEGPSATVGVHPVPTISIAGDETDESRREESASTQNPSNSISTEEHSQPPIHFLQVPSREH
jgi:hypothetical protein